MMVLVYHKMAVQTLLYTEYESIQQIQMMELAIHYCKWLYRFNSISEYDPLANTDDGSCIAVVNGCTDLQH